MRTSILPLALAAAVSIGFATGADAQLVRTGVTITGASAGKTATGVTIDPAGMSHVDLGRDTCMATGVGNPVACGVHAVVIGGVAEGSRRTSSACDKIWMECPRQDHIANGVIGAPKF